MNIEDSGQLARAFGTTFAADQPRPDCPSADHIWEGTQGELSATDLRALVEHLAVCPLCTQAWRMAEKLEDVSLTKTSSRRRVLTSRGFRGVLAMAATALAIVSVVPLLDRDTQTPTAPTLRQGEVSSIQLLSGGSLSRNDCLLRWQGPAETPSYKLRVIVADNPLSPPLVDETNLTITDYQIPPELLQHLPPNSQLQAHLEATAPIGGQSADKIFYFIVE